MLKEDLSKVTEDQKTAVRAVIRVVGPDVDPFNSVKQARANICCQAGAGYQAVHIIQTCEKCQAAITNAIQSSMTTVEADNINILKVSSVTSTATSQSSTTSDDDSSSSSTSADSTTSSSSDGTGSATSADSTVDNSRRRQLLTIYSNHGNQIVP